MFNIKVKGNFKLDIPTSTYGEKVSLSHDYDAEVDTSVNLEDIFKTGKGGGKLFGLF